MDELKKIQDLLLQNGISSGKTIGIIGAGKFGCLLRDAAKMLKADINLCDPPRSREESDELNDALHVEWGNGMGGCDFSALRTETFLPMDFLAHFSDVILIAVPLTENGQDATAGLISPAFLNSCRANCKILCFSDPGVIAPEIRNDLRIAFLS